MRRGSEKQKPERTPARRPQQRGQSRPHQSHRKCEQEGMTEPAMAEFGGVGHTQAKSEDVEIGQYRGDDSDGDQARRRLVSPEADAMARGMAGCVRSVGIGSSSRIAPRHGAASACTHCHAWFGPSSLRCPANSSSPRHQREYAPAQVLARIGGVTYGFRSQLPPNLCRQLIVGISFEPATHG